MRCRLPQELSHLPRRLFGELLVPIFRRQDNHHAAPRTGNFVGQVVARNFLLDLVTTMFAAQCRLHRTEHIVCGERHGKGEQRSLRISQRLQFAFEGSLQFLEGRFDRPSLAINLRNAAGIDRLGQICQNMAFRQNQWVEDSGIV